MNKSFGSSWFLVILCLILSPYGFFTGDRNILRECASSGPGFERSLVGPPGPRSLNRFPK